MIIILCGGMGCGKDFIRKGIVGMWGFKNLVTYTTRPMRDGEQNGEEYWFINKEEFFNKVNSGEIIEYREYKVANGEIWYYGSSKVPNINNNYVGILDLTGAKKFQDVYGDNVKIVEVLCNTETRMERAIKRNDNINEIIRRIKQDEIDFSNKTKDEIGICINFKIINEDNTPLENTLNALSRWLYLDTIRYLTRSRGERCE